MELLDGPGRVPGVPDASHYASSSGEWTWVGPSEADPAAEPAEPKQDYVALALEPEPAEPEEDYADLVVEYPLTRWLVTHVQQVKDCDPHDSLVVRSYVNDQKQQLIERPMNVLTSRSA